ncbi:MAG: hypothetical protein CMC10_04340 [Flavobacteriaceae bacterium]|nr:hypothetical protein [Flavobacteriaceae bacterium]
MIFHLLITTTSNALVVFPVTFLGYKLTWAAFVFPLVVVATDLTVRLLGKKIAQKTITYTYPLAIIFSILVVFIEKDSLNIAIRVGFASATSYALGIVIDIFAFQQIRNNYKAWWIAPSLSTVISNFIDTYTFFFTAFYNSKDMFMSENWTEIAFNQTIIKIFIGILFFLPVYGFLLKIILKFYNKN